MVFTWRNEAHSDFRDCEYLKGVVIDFIFQAQEENLEWGDDMHIRHTLDTSLSEVYIVIPFYVSFSSETKQCSNSDR